MRRRISIFILCLITMFNHSAYAETKYVVFGGGCFWCMEPPFDKTPGVLETIAGYSGGQDKMPTYENVSKGHTGHTEVVKVVYNSKKVSLEDLLEVFWRNIDPFVKNSQFCDFGTQYRSAVFYQSTREKQLIEKSLDKIQSKFKEKKIYTEILKFEEFYKAEDYHQNYYMRNPIRYKFYRFNCKRDKRLQEIWGN